MKLNLREVVMNRQQFHRSALPGRQTEDRLLERRVRTTFVNVPSALPCRPEPRSAFDNAARRENPSAPWKSFADPLRATALAAQSCDVVTREATRTHLLDAILAFAGYVLAPLDEGVPLDVVLFTRLIQEEGEAIEAQALARGFGTTEARAAAVRETEEAIVASRLYVAHERRAIDSTPRTLALV